jgi:hypothetical protein
MSIRLMRTPGMKRKMAMKAKKEKEKAMIVKEILKTTKIRMRTKEKTGLKGSFR